jgi:transposase InsO family protein
MAARSAAPTPAHRRSLARVEDAVVVLRKKVLKRAGGILSPEALRRRYDLSSAMPTPRRVFLSLVASVAISLGAAMSQVWAFGPRQRRGLGRFQVRLDVERLEAHLRLLTAWFARSKYHPRYRRQEWIHNLEYAARWGVSAAALARDLVVSGATAHRRLSLRDKGGFAAPYVKPGAPCVRIDDGRRQLVVDMAVGGFVHDSTIARNIHCHGEKISARSVGRIRAEASVSAPARKNRGAKAQKPRRPVVDTPDAAELAASYVPGAPARPRPRKARLLRALASAFAECIARDTLWDMEEESLDTEADELHRTRLSQRLAILLARFRRIPPHKRPHYTAAERGHLLTFKNRFRLSHKTLAAWFLLDPNTLSTWNLDVDHPERRRRPLVEPIADVRTAIASLAEHLPPIPKRLTQTVADAVVALAHAVIARRRRHRTNDPRGDAIVARSVRERSPVDAQYPNHFWCSDITVIVLGCEFHLAAIIDLYSRDILAWELFTSAPTAIDIKALIDAAAARFGKPKHFLTDQGTQFKSDLLKDALDEMGVDHRQGAVGEHGSIAIIERLWRTLKGHLDFTACRQSVPEMLRQRVAVVVDYYRTKRPHIALGNATPEQLYTAQQPPAATATKPPRGWRGQQCSKAPFVVRYAFDTERTLPYLERIG